MSHAFSTLSSRDLQLGISRDPGAAADSPGAAADLVRCRAQPRDQLDGRGRRAERDGGGRAATCVGGAPGHPTGGDSDLKGLLWDKVHRLEVSGGEV